MSSSAAEDVLRGGPVGRRLFLALLGAGAAGLAVTRFAYAGDDATPGNVATAVPVGAMTPDDREPVEGIHPNIVQSERFRYYSVADIPSLGERSWRLTVDGAGLGGSMSLRLADVQAFPNVANRPNAGAQHVTFYAGDGVYTDSLTMGQARSDHALLAWELNGRPLIREQGAPLRLIVPDMYGYKNVKWVRRIEVKPVHDLGFWEQRGWDDDAYVYTPPPSRG
jgi:DMSO/TMAO reductase YedYZ molybdopterin-dependent catalytic subunit